GLVREPEAGRDAFLAGKGLVDELLGFRPGGRREPGHSGGLRDGLRELAGAVPPEEVLRRTEVREVLLRARDAGKGVLAERALDLRPDRGLIHGLPTRRGADRAFLSGLA